MLERVSRRALRGTPCYIKVSAGHHVGKSITQDTMLFKSIRRTPCYIKVSAGQDKHTIEGDSRSGVHSAVQSQKVITVTVSMLYKDVHNYLSYFYDK